ncbi:uncharacterized protein [Antedon mediterranea]|uniref:uncharacterized protein isoform X1 n=2 Tax=Antedon mediterranea TaxID=105859 RepID=UPI003AF9409C
MVFCMAFGCSNASSRKDRKSTNKVNVSFHRLPLHNKDLLRKWVASLKLENPHVNVHSRVCSEHFEKDMFEDNSVKVSLGRKPTRRLKPDAVPTQLAHIKPASEASKRRQDRQKLMEQKRWPKKKVLDMGQVELDETSIPRDSVEVIQPEILFSEGCKCGQVTKVNSSTQTDTFADPLKIQHDHSYVKLFKKKPKSVAKTRKCPSASSTASIPQNIPQVPEEEDSEVDNSDNDSDEDVDSDSSYSPSSSDSDSETNTAERKKSDGVFLVYESSLDHLFNTCQECGSLLEIHKLYRGTMIVFEWTCHNNHRGRWKSQPLVRNMAKGNLELAASILFSGGTYQKMFDIATTMKLHMLSEKHFYNIQRSYLFPVINDLYNENHGIWIDAFRYQDIFVGGDGRSDTPGHSAKYLGYSLMEENSELIIHFELVQVSEAPGQASTNMERVGFTRAIDYLLEEDVNVVGVTTDRHVQIASDMNKNYPELKHEFDIFHVVKSVTKKLREKSKKKGCEDLRFWIPSIKNHLWWCCASCNGDYADLKDKWLSLLQHVCNLHEWASADKFHKCSHDPLLEDMHEIEWLTPGSDAHDALRGVVMNTKLLKDMHKMALFKHTGSLEVFHGMLLKYCPKREHFSYEGMRARHQLAIMDHNENVGRQQATTEEGTLRFGLAFPKRKKQWVLKKIYVDKTFEFRKRLMEMVCDRREDSAIVLGQRYVDRPDLPTNIASSEKPEKEDAIEDFRTRFLLS